MHRTHFQIHMRTKLLLVAACLLSSPGQAAEEGAQTHTHAHAPQVFHAVTIEAAGGITDEGKDALDWDLKGWLGTDENKVYLRSEIERQDGKFEQQETWLLYSRNISTFWDAQIGARHDTTPSGVTYAVLGFDGLAPYFFETEAHLFISEDGDALARLRVENEFLLTQRWHLEPYIELNFAFEDVKERETGAGLSEGEFGFKTLYTVSPRFAPYLDLRFEKSFGETADFLRDDGEGTSHFIALFGSKLLF